jgi:ATP-binding cassette subfamily B protein
MRSEGGIMRPTPAPVLRTLRRDPSVGNAKVAPGTTKRIWEFVRPYKAVLITFLVLVVIDAAAGVAPPLVYSAIIDHVLAFQKGGHALAVLGIPAGAAGVAWLTRLIIGAAVLLALLAALDGGLSLGERWLSSRVGEGLIFDMRTKVFAHVERMPLAFFTRTQTGALVSRLNNDVIGAQEAFTDVLSTVVGNLIGVAFVLTLMFYLSWQLTLAALVLVPTFMLPARWVGQRLQAALRERYDLIARMNTTMVERFNVAGALLVKLFGRMRDEDESFAADAGRVRDIGIVQSMYARVFFVSLALTAGIATALVYGWGGMLALQGAITVGTLIALAAYLNRLYGPITALSNIQVDIMTALVSFERVFEVLDLPLIITEREDAVPLERGPARIEFDHVSFAYPTADEISLASLESIAAEERSVSTTVLHDISFTVEPGQLVALVGPSGAGKTTISHLVPRLYDASAGAVRINGVDVREATLDSLHDLVGVVTQDAHMFHDTVRANLLYARPDATQEELVAAATAARIMPLIESLPDGFDTLVGERGYRLSGGEKQRLAIARLLLKAPDIVVLDEATAHLDSESEQAVQHALEAALTGRTSLVIAHRLSTIRGADRIIVIDDGRVVESGPHAELLAAGGLYAQLYWTQYAKGEQPPDGALAPAGA